MQGVNHTVPSGQGSSTSHMITTKDSVGTVSKFCLLKTVRRWPYKKTSKTSQMALKRFFDKEPFFDRPWDIYTVESSESGSLGGIFVPFQQVKVFFEETQSETDVMLSTKDRDLVFNLSDQLESTIRFVGTSQSLAEYENISEALVGSNYQNVSQPHQQSKDVRKAKSENKRQAQLQNRLNMLKSASDIVTGNGQDHAFFSIDVESWEKNHDIITEVGLTCYIPGHGGWKSSVENTDINSDHIIVKEHRFYKNGDYVADASGKFEFGESRYIPLAEVKTAIATFMDTGCGKHRKFVLVGHDVNIDIEYLRKLGYDLELVQAVMIFDTMEMWKAMTGNANGISLKRLCNELNIDAWNLHNAGNDARYTMHAFLEMATKGSAGIAIVDEDK